MAERQRTGDRATACAWREKRRKWEILSASGWHGSRTTALCRTADLSILTLPNPKGASHAKQVASEKDTISNLLPPALIAR